MRRILTVVVLTALCTTACARRGYRVEMAPAPGSLSSYTQLYLPPVETESFLNAHPEITNSAEAQKWRDEIALCSTQVVMAAQQHLQGRYQVSNSETSGALNVKTELIEMNPGSRAARFWVGAGAGRGRVGIRVTLTGAGGETIGIGVAYGEITGGWGGGSFHDAYNYCGLWLARFILDYAR